MGDSLSDHSSWHEIAEWDWVLLDDEDGDTIHAVGSTTNDTEEEWYGDGKTVCGIQADMFIPGLFTRMSTDVHRCEACCEATGMPKGAMSPKNVDECRPICEARIAALATDEQEVPCEDCSHDGHTCAAFGCAASRDSQQTEEGR